MADKFYLKVKSGPGELVGVSELESTDNVINFNGVQFTEPGDYIITAFSSSGKFVFDYHRPSAYELYLI